MKRLWPVAGLTGLILTAVAVPAQQIHRNGFETRTPVWVKQNADAKFREQVHATTDTTAHTGQLCEHIQVQAEQGTFIHYAYPACKAPLGEELSASVWIKANRPGVQVLARLVLPRERNPKNLEEPLTTLLRGDKYRQVSRWERLELRRPLKLAKEQQQLLRAELKRDVDLTDAYVDRLLLNVYGGPGLTEVWVDDLEVGPVVDTPPFLATSRPASPTPFTFGGEKGKSVGGAPEKATRPEMPALRPGRATVVEMNQDHLLVNSRRFFIRGIRYSDTPLKVLRDAGFNTLWFDYSAPPAQLEEAVNLGFWLVPTLPADGGEQKVVTSEAVGQVVNKFLEKDAVLFWYLGGGLSREQAPKVQYVANLIRGADPQRPIGVNAWDGFLPYTRTLDLVGTHRWPLMTGLELSQYRDWLNQRRLLGRPDAYLWTWVQTHLPDWYTALVYDRPGNAGFNEPIGPQPEQIRLLTYIALASGAKGLGFWSDRFLADSHQGRDRLLTLALLNLELRMLEPLLVSVAPPDGEGWVNTSISEVKAAVLRGEPGVNSSRGVLVLPIWLGQGSQFVPGQAATNKLSLTVPQVPASAQAWWVSPGEVRSLRTERVSGGTRVTVPEFGLTGAIVFTADTALVERFQDQVRQTQSIATQWAYDLALEELKRVTQVNTELERLGKAQRDGTALLADAQRRVRRCYELAGSRNHREAYAEAQRALRPLRILMRAQWDEAARAVGNPVASPYAVSYFTLPRHWRLVDQIRRGTPGANVLPDGGFETSGDATSLTWVVQEAALDDVELTARRVEEAPKEGKQCLLLQIKPRNAQQLPPKALERTYLAIQSRPVRLAPGSLVRVSGWVKVPAAIGASVDGALLFDSAGGEPLAVRLTAAQDWQQVALYRQVPPNGELTVTAALTGLGQVYFDDLRIEPLDGSGAAAVQAGR